jgi:hypothetical protein
MRAVAGAGSANAQWLGLFRLKKVLCRKKCEPGPSGVPARAALKMIKKCKLKDSRCI